MGKRAAIVGLVAVASLAALGAALASSAALDTRFGTGGKAVTDVGSADYAAAVVVQPDGRIVVAGGSGSDLAVARYDGGGRLDPGFAGDGIAVTDVGAHDAAGAVALQPDGKIVAVGSSGGRLVLVRYTSEGVLDTSFGSDGIVAGVDARGIGVFVRPDGRLVAVATRTYALVLARYLPDGRPDATFGRRGLVVTPTPRLSWRTAARGPRGTIVVAGREDFRTPTRPSALAVARYRADGRLDRSFSRDGLVVLAPRPHWAGSVDVAVRRDGRVVLGTHGHAGATQGFAIVQLRRDGSLDRSFGSGGTRVSPVGYGVRALEVDARGRIVAVGETTRLSDFVVARFLASGAWDGDFGEVVTDFGARDTPLAVALQQDGKIVAVGASGAPNLVWGDFALARYQAGG
jgi:uncharacterized delta-60 repeat protein